MAHIKLGDGLPGIRGLLVYSPATAKPIGELAEVLLRGPSTLSRAERELIATHVSFRNECHYCQSCHGAIAAEEFGGADVDYALVDQVKRNAETAPVSAKMKALLAIAGHVQQGGKRVTAGRRRAGAARGRDRSGDSRRRPHCRGLLHVQPLRRWPRHLAAEQPGLLSGGRQAHLGAGLRQPGLLDAGSGMTTASAPRGLGLWSATALVISNTIAVGIFLTPAELIGALASPALTFGLWLTCGVMVLAGAFTFGELASRYPQAGGLYVYLREAWGPRVAFLYGWQSLLVMDPGLTAALALGASQYIVVIWPATAGYQPWVAVSDHLDGCPPQHGRADVRRARIRPAHRAEVVHAGGHCRHCVRRRRRQLVALRAILLLAGERPGAPPIGEAIALGLVGVFFSFGGFWETSRIAGEVRDARRTLPRALVLGVMSVTAIYVMTTAGLHLSRAADRGDERVRVRAPRGRGVARPGRTIGPRHDRRAVGRAERNGHDHGSAAALRGHEQRWVVSSGRCRTPST